MAKMQVLCFLAIWVGLAAALEGPKAPPRHLPELFAMQGSKKSNSREKGYSKTSDTDKRDRKSDSDEEDVYSHPKKNTPRYRGSDSKGKGKGAPKPWPTYSPYPTYSPHPTPPPSVTTSPQSPTYGPKAPDPPPITKGAEPQRSKKKKYGSKSDKGMSKMNKSPGKKVTMPPTTISPTPPPVPLTPTASPAPSAPSTPVPVIETMSPTTAPPGAPTAAPVISQPTTNPGSSTRIQLAGVSIEYDIAPTLIPPISDIEAVAAVTLSFLRNYFQRNVAFLEDLELIVVGEDLDFPVYTIDYLATATIGGGALGSITQEDLDDVLEDAFQGTSLQEYLELIQSLPAANNFSRATGVVAVETPASRSAAGSAEDSGSRFPVTLMAAAGAVSFALILLGVGLNRREARMMRDGKGFGDGDDKHAEVTLAGDTYAETTVASTSKDYSSISGYSSTEYESAVIHEVHEESDYENDMEEGESSADEEGDDESEYTEVEVTVAEYVEDEAEEDDAKAKQLADAERAAHIEELVSGMQYDVNAADNMMASISSINMDDSFLGTDSLNFIQEEEHSSIHSAEEESIYILEAPSGDSEHYSEHYRQDNFRDHSRNSSYAAAQPVRAPSVERVHAPSVERSSSQERPEATTVPKYAHQNSHQRELEAALRKRQEREFQAHVTLHDSNSHQSDGASAGERSTSTSSRVSDLIKRFN